VAAAVGSGVAGRVLSVAPRANAGAPVASDHVAWVWWLAPPVVATIVASIGSWLRSRPAPVPDTAEAMQAHRDYLAALANGARWSDTGASTDSRD
jgi:hypothetical protein